MAALADDRPDVLARCDGVHMTGEHHRLGIDRCIGSGKCRDQVADVAADGLAGTIKCHSKAQRFQLALQ